MVASSTLSGVRLLSIDLDSTLMMVGMPVATCTQTHMSGRACHICSCSTYISPAILRWLTRPDPCSLVHLTATRPLPVARRRSRPTVKSSLYSVLSSPCAAAWPAPMATAFQPP
jgi:hypothetical protein